MLSEEDVRHIAKLARIALSDEDVSKFAKRLSVVLDYMDILNECDVSEVEGTNQVTGLENVCDKDEVVKSQSSPEELLACSELPVDSNQIRVLPAIKGI
ncbi:Asp-tRNA(Asn)/Glu-tRNA(Gln) amidotransferase subunit GatC [Candidatus Gracilibacteria bacterium]|nr:Asp-tRNA(Asn)/Glu-tRNA(Gln) amidotransferase subunit GatC [Candidatus Gracilibacteria bacterium]